MVLYVSRCMKGPGFKAGLAVALAVLGALAWPSAGAAATANTITIAPNTVNQGNCWPFGGFLSDGGWNPNFAFVYKNIPAFHLRPRDLVAFDTFSVNETDATLDVAMAGTTVNGNDVNNGPFTTIATNAQTPANPRGNTTAGDYELQWTASGSFDFPGGGLLIRFSNASGAFATDATCAADLVGAANSGDTSGFFVGRRFRDTDGVSPWDDGDASVIGQFRLTLVPTSSIFTLGKVARNKRKGTAEVPVSVPGPGTLTLSGKGVKAQTAAGEGAHLSVAAAGTVKLKIKPKGKAKKKLRSRHKAKVAVSITFAPNGDPTSGHPAGDPSTQKTKVKLIRR